MTRFMLYNVYRGGEGRLDKIASVVNDIRPDFLGVLEAVGWGDGHQQTLRQFADKSEFAFSHFTKSNTKYDLALLARQEPQSVQEFREGFWHVLLRVDTPLLLGEQLIIILLHLNPHKEEDRMCELEQLYHLINTSPHTILMGDFNSLSPHDPCDRAKLLKTLQESGMTK